MPSSVPQARPLLLTACGSQYRPLSGSRVAGGPLGYIRMRSFYSPHAALRAGLPAVPVRLLVHLAIQAYASSTHRMRLSVQASLRSPYGCWAA